MAKKNKDGPSPAELRLLEALPQRFDIWQAGAREADFDIEEGGESVRPWLVLVASSTEGLVLAHEVVPTMPGTAHVWALLSRAMQEPLAGDPHRPTSVQFDDETWTAGLEPYLDAIDVPGETVADLEHLDEVIEELSADMVGPDQPGLLEAPGVTAEMIGDLFDAAAGFYQQAPWQRIGERAIQVECPRFESGPWYAVMMGQAGMTAGLVLYDSFETLERIRTETLSHEESARITAALVVVFGEEDDLAPVDLEAAREHGWRVAGPNAYPAIYRMEPGLIMRPPLAWETELLEGCLRAIPEFVRKKPRRPMSVSFTALVSSGDLPLLLSWAAE